MMALSLAVPGALANDSEDDQAADDQSAAGDDRCRTYEWRKGLVPVQADPDGCLRDFVSTILRGGSQSSADDSPDEDGN